ncbi:MAG TPA: hypothetical protein PLK90_01245 [Clostridiales bacterium]|nr:hypothetical protein [Clostridiales bacterium]HQP69002.1 hypothetical protein [Clostridiales bacterium]
MAKWFKLSSLSLLSLLLFGCTRTIELVGYGPALPEQNGLEANLISSGKEGAFIQVKNISDEIITVNQSPLAIKISVLTSGKPVVPSGRIKIHMDTNPDPDDFVIISPGQTRTINITVSSKGGIYRAFDTEYKIKNGVLYDVEVQVEPYFGTFNEKTAPGILKDFKIPNYRYEIIRANSMTIRSR